MQPLKWLSFWQVLCHLKTPLPFSTLLLSLCEAFVFVSASRVWSHTHALVNRLGARQQNYTWWRVFVTNAVPVSAIQGTIMLSLTTTPQNRTTQQGQHLLLVLQDPPTGLHKVRKTTEKKRKEKQRHRIDGKRPVCTTQKGWMVYSSGKLGFVGKQRDSGSNHCQTEFSLWKLWFTGCCSRRGHLQQLTANNGKHHCPCEKNGTKSGTYCSGWPRTHL